MSETVEKPRSEPTYFIDPVLDRVTGMVMALAAEVWVLRDRNRALERILEGSGALAPGALDRYQPTAEEAAALVRDRDDFVKALMDHLLGQQTSKTPG